MTFSTRTKSLIAAGAAAAVIGIGAIAIGPPPDRSPGGGRVDAADIAASGASTISFTDPVHDRSIDVSLWTPTTTDPAHLVVLSHGFGGGRTSHEHLGSALAAEGYWVVAPTHPDLAGLESGQGDLDPLVLRPRHLSLAIDAAESELGRSFETVSVVGHSMGAYSALRVAGAEAEASGDLLAQHCEAEDDQVLCTDPARARLATLAEAGGTATDARVERIALLAPGYGPVFEPASLGTLDVEVLVIDAASDTEVSTAQVDALSASLGPDAQRVTVDGGHFVFVRTCSAEEASAVPEICEDPAGVDRTEIHDRTIGHLTTFLAS